MLNAKLHQKEADIVAEAGKESIVTIATNMAGRGTDIKLSDNVKNNGGLAIISERHDSEELIVSYEVVPVVKEIQVLPSSTHS